MKPSPIILQVRLLHIEERYLPDVYTYQDAPCTAALGIGICPKRESLFVRFPDRCLSYGQAAVDPSVTPVRCGIGEVGHLSSPRRSREISSAMAAACSAPTPAVLRSYSSSPRSSVSRRSVFAGSSCSPGRSTRSSSTSIITLAGAGRG